jgi:hypothetical protein
MEEGLLRHENDRDDRRITACVILSTFVAVCSSFSYGCAVSFLISLSTLFCHHHRFLSDVPEGTFSPIIHPSPHIF